MAKRTKAFIVIAIEIITLVILLINSFIISDWSTVLEMKISDAIEVSVLTLVSYLLVSKDNEDSRKKDSIIRLITKIQDLLSDFSNIEVSSDSTKKITRAKLNNISNYIEILNKAIPDNSGISSIIQDKEALSAIILDHIDDNDYISKSQPDIIKYISTINMKLEQLIFDIL